MNKLFYKIFFTILIFILCTGSNYSNWKKVDIPPNFERDRPFLEVMFLKNNPKLGWICGYNGRVLRTVDGGITWTGRIIPNADQLESIIFLDSLNGYTSGPEGIFKSTDGGVSWRDVTDRINNVNFLWGNYFTTKDIGMVIGGGCDNRQKFYRTTNGGVTWSINEKSEIETGMTDIYLFSSTGLGYAASSGRLWRTLDGGFTWDIFSISGGNDWQEELAISGNTFLLPYSTECSGYGNNGGLRISTNGGMNWNEFQTGQRMFGTFLQDEQRGWGVGLNRSIYFTSDGGITWVPRNCGIEPGDDLDDIWFINDTLGWVVGINVYKTFNYDTLDPVITASATEKCEGDSIILKVNKDYPNYYWSTGEKSKSIVVKESGTYYLTVSNTECDSTKSNLINIKFHPAPKPNIIVSDSIICEDDSARMSLPNKYQQIRWSNGECSESITVNKEGTYSVTVTDSNGCVGTASQYITVIANPKPEIKKIARQVSCIGDSIVLETSPQFSEYSWYNSDKNLLVGSGSNRLVVIEDGNYFVIVKNSYGCIGVSDTINANFIVDSNRIQIDILSSNVKQLTFDSTNLLGMLCQRIRIRNIGPDTEIINEITVFRNIEFSIPQAQLPIILLPSDSFDLEICYAPIALGENYDTLEFNDNCFPHFLPILGIGKPNIYSTGTKCDIPVKLISSGLYGYQLNVLPPLPNPASNTVSLEFLRFIPDGESFVESCRIYNSIGSESASGKLNIEEQNFNKNGILSSGKIEYDVQHLADGLYYVVIKSKNYNYIYPVIINK